MACTIEVTLISEQVDGDIGDDWQYALSAEVFNPDSIGLGPPPPPPPPPPLSPFPHVSF